MMIVHDWPPMVDEIDAAFKVRRMKGVIFAWGDRIYLPHGGTLPSSLMAHEKVHGERQLAMGIEAWWREYIANPEFRLAEEIPAHRAEYRDLCRTNRKSKRPAMLRQVAARLASPLYGNIISLREAREVVGAP